jgi:hypothetical protein
MGSYIIPVLVGSDVDVRQISVFPKYMKPNLSYWRPMEVTVRLKVTLLNLHLGGL